jgi:hypothetical protein
MKKFPTCALFVAACGPVPASTETSATASKTDPWTYHVYVDDMRKERTWIANNYAKNPAQLDFPYDGGTDATIQLSQDETDDPQNRQAILTLHNGQIDCGGDCDVSLKFDDGEVIESNGTKTDCGTAQCINLNVDSERLGSKGYQGFHDRLKASKRLTVEVPIFNFGPYQFHFDISGLVWPQPGAPTTGKGTGIADGSTKF